MGMMPIFEPKERLDGLPENLRTSAIKPPRNRAMSPITTMTVNRGCLFPDISFGITQRSYVGSGRI